MCHQGACPMSVQQTSIEVCVQGDAYAHRLRRLQQELDTARSEFKKEMDTRCAQPMSHKHSGHDMTTMHNSSHLLAIRLHKSSRSRTVLKYITSVYNITCVIEWASTVSGLPEYVQASVRACTIARQEYNATLAAAELNMYVILGLCFIVSVFVSDCALI